MKKTKEFRKALDNLLISLNEVEFIDAAYEMLCWCAENGYLETK